MNRIALLCIFSLMLFSSCNTKLTRSKAKDLIVNQYGFPKATTDNLPFGFPLNYPGNGKLENYPFEKFLVDKGLITFSVMGTVHYMLSNDGVQIGLMPTTEGMKYKLGLGQSPQDANISVYFMKVADREFVDITGIQEENETSATVSYTWKYDKVTPFGEAFAMINQKNQNGLPIYTDGSPHTEQVTFKKFDDGWRITP